MQFSVWMRRTRISKGLSVTECAQRAEVSQPAWSEWETAEPGKDWRQATLRKIATGLDEPLSVVQNAACETDEATPDVNFAKMLNSYLGNLPENRRKIAEDVLIHTARSFAALSA